MPPTPITIGGAGPITAAGELTGLDVRQDGNAVRVLNGWNNITFTARWELNPTAYALAAATGNPWRIALDAESLGQGFEGRLHTGQLANNAGVFNAGTNMFEFEYVGNVNAPTPDEHQPNAGGDSGIYKLVGSIFNNGVTPFLDLVAFDEVQLVMHEPLE